MACAACLTAIARLAPARDTGSGGEEAAPPSGDPRDEGGLARPLRFTFMYRREGGRGEFVSDHASRMPAP